jgi:hypothetical protein
MATLALAAATTPMGSLQTGILNGLQLPAAETALGANTGFSFPNDGMTLLRVVIGASGAGNLTFVIQKLVEGILDAPLVLAVGNTTTWIFGPFSRADFNDSNGLFQGLLSVQTGNSVGVYQQQPRALT